MTKVKKTKKKIVKMLKEKGINVSKKEIGKVLKSKLKAVPANRSVTTKDLRFWVESFYDIQKVRCMIESRLRQHKDNEEAPSVALVEKFNELRLIEADLEKKIAEEIKKYQIWSKWLKPCICGIGPVLGAGLISYIDSIDKFSNISKLWRYSGQGVINVCKECNKIQKDKDGDFLFDRNCPFCGNADPAKFYGMSERLMKNKNREKGEVDDDKNKKGKKDEKKKSNLHFNPRFKVVCWKIGVQFVMQGKEYRKLYDDYKIYYRKKHPKKIKVKSPVSGKMITKYNDGHIHNMAIRKTVKIFLQHLWITWRTLEGLSVTKPYAIDIQKHADYIEPASVRPASL